jgi:hypothetical protein
LFPFFITFDFPDPGVTVGKRAITTVASQALLLLNNPFVKAQAEATADGLLRLTTPTERVTRLYQVAVQRDPTTAEIERIHAFIGAFGKSEKVASKADRTAWAAVVQAVFASSEFCTVE